MVETNRWQVEAVCKESKKQSDVKCWKKYK